jgi:hypothetical protein
MGIKWIRVVMVNRGGGKKTGKGGVKKNLP